MPSKEKLAGPMTEPIKRILVSIAILLLTFPFRLLAQKPRLECRKFLVDPERHYAVDIALRDSLVVGVEGIGGGFEEAGKTWHG